MKGFSNDDRERIREELIEEGQELFARFGLERTRIKDITEAVEIGTSTFYQFFDSKEELYAAVLLRERDRLDEKIIEAIEPTDSPREQARVTLETTFEEIESNPLIYRLIVEGELHSVQQHLSAEEQQALVKNIETTKGSYVEEWTAHPEFRYDDPEIVHALLKTLVFVSRSKNVLWTNDARPQYEEIRDSLIDIVVDGLFVSE
ncbi:TetR/AcrR family transcriptional regulator [Halopiger djelfimassiliensis]|uniref:TetR/AcrR family transcriptional regulator n=1 Tax=Halopiger djelfimassiliensis TaxID=1293047 RepID=UPI000677ACAB|nr:TetR/AcrR family transcriptional regulator [Halopiger djelfimassiliensis]